MLSTIAVMDIKVHHQVVRSFTASPRHEVLRFLSAVKADCQSRKLAWQVYRAVKRDALKMGLI